MIWIGMGAETVVDYALRFKRQWGPGTWVMGYADDMILTFLHDESGTKADTKGHQPLRIRPSSQPLGR